MLIKTVLRPYIHTALHFLIPALVAFAFYRDNFWRSTAVMWATIVIDVDHFLADPVYDPGRCSIGFHPLHQYPAIAVYFGAVFWKRTRLIATGLLIHMMLDGVDCLWMQYDC